MYVQHRRRWTYIELKLGEMFRHENPAIIAQELTKLFFPGLVADRGSEMHGAAVRQSAPHVTGEHSQAGLLQDIHVVVVGVSHGPAAGMAPGVLWLLRVHVLTVVVGPFFVVLWLDDLQQMKNVWGFLNR